MSILVTFNGQNYIIPETNEVGWGANLDDYLVAISTGALQKTGGSFLLSNELDFGASFGIKSLYYKSRTANPSATGILRLANADGIGWRNGGNSGDLTLTVNSSNQLTFNGIPISGAGVFAPNQAIISGGSGALITSVTTATELSYVSGVTSSIQTQLNGKLTAAGGTVNGDLTFSSGFGTVYTDSGVKTVRLAAPTTVTTSYTMKWPIAQGASGQYLTDDGSGNLFWSNAAGTGTVNSGTQYQLGYYATTSNAISGNSSILTNASNQLLIIDGTASIPALAFSGAPTTGIFRTGGMIGFTSAGTQVAAISGSGRIRATATATVTVPDFSWLTDTSTGMYEVATSDIGFATAGVLRLDISTTAVTSTLPYINASGAVGTPAYSFSASPTSGMYLLAANDLGFATNGVLQLEINTTNILPRLATLFPIGTASLPSLSFSGDTNTGVYHIGADDMGLATGGTLRLELSTTAIASSLPVYLPAGTNTAPSLSFSGTTSLGMYRFATDAIGFTTAGLADVLLIGATAVTANVPVSILSTTANQSYLLIEDTALSQRGNVELLAASTSSDISIAVNRTWHGGSGGTSLQTGQAAAAVVLQSQAADGAIFFYTTATNNADPALRLTVDKNGLVTIAQNLAVSGTSAFTGQASLNGTTGNPIHGTSDTGDAAAGYVGEYVISSISTGGTNITTSLTYQDFTTISLTAGDWDVSGILEIIANGATYTAVAAAISINSGNTTTDQVIGTNAIASGTNGTLDTISITPYRIVVSAASSPQTVYIKGRATFSAGNPQMSRGHIRARRIR